MVETSFLPGVGSQGLVSVIVPCYNRADIVAETIDSLLAQTYSKIEVLVVDDGSTDNTREIVTGYADPRIRYFFKPNGGLSAARNFGLDYAAGEFIAFLDSDDLWHPWKLAAQIRLFDVHPDIGLIWSDMSTFSRLGTVLSGRHLREYYSAYEVVEFERNHEPAGVLSDLTDEAPLEFASAPYYVADVFPHMFSGNLVHPSTAIVRRDRLRQSGPFEPEVTGPGGEDYHFYFRVCSKGQVAFIDAPTTLYRIHDSQMSACNRLKEAQGNLSVITHWIAQRPSAVPTGVLRNSLASAHAWLGSEQLNAGDSGEATRHLWRSLQLRGGSVSTMRLLLIALLPRSIAETLRSLKRLLRPGAVRPISGLLLLLIDDFDGLFAIADLLQVGALPGI